MIKPLLSFLQRAALCIAVSALPVSATPSDCAKNPTQSCLFDLAFETAKNATEKPTTWSRKLISVAIALEPINPTKSAQVLDHLVAQAPDQFESPKQNLWGLRLPFILIERPLTLRHAPKMAATLNDLVVDLEDQLSSPREKHLALKTRAMFLGYTPSLKDLNALIFSAPETARGDLISAAAQGLNARGQTKQLRALLAQLPPGRPRDETLYDTLHPILLNADFESALAIVALIEHPPIRADGYVTIMQAYDRGEDRASAKDIAQHLEDTVDLDVAQTRAALMSLYAAYGDDAALQRIIDSDPSPNADQVAYLKALSQMVRGNLDPIFAYYDNAAFTHFLFSAQFHETLRVYRASGQTDMTPFIDYFSKPHPLDKDSRELFYRLLNLGSEQAKMGDADGAQMTFFRADFVAQHMIPDDFPIPYVSRSLRPLERLLAQKAGLQTEITSAYERADVEVLITLARNLPE